MATTVNALERRPAARTAPGGVHRASNRSRFARLACVLALAGCGGGSEVLVVPLFLFGFGDTPNKVNVFFSPDQPTTASGQFTSVNISVDGTAAPAAIGSWSGCSLTVSVSGTPTAPIAKEYSGGFISKDVIRLTPNDASLPVLNLTRLGVATNPPNCP